MELHRWRIPSDIVIEGGLDALAQANSLQYHLILKVARLLNQVRRRRRKIATLVEHLNREHKLQVLVSMTNEQAIRRLKRKEEREAAAETKNHEARHRVFRLMKAKDQLVTLEEFVEDTQKALTGASINLSNQRNIAEINLHLSGRE